MKKLFSCWLVSLSILALSACAAAPVTEVVVQPSFTPTAPAPASPTGTPETAHALLVTWERSGGFAGICQQLNIYAEGRFTFGDCNAEPNSMGYLEKDDLVYVQELVQAYPNLRWQKLPPAGSADMFTDSYVLYGQGSKSANRLVQQELADFLERFAAQAGQQAPES